MPKDSEEQTKSRSKSERAGLALSASRAARISVGVIGKTSKKSKKPRTQMGGSYPIMLAAGLEVVMETLLDAMMATGDKQFGVNTVKKAIRQDPELRILFKNVVAV